MHIIRPMQLGDVDRVHKIELAAHRAPWSRTIIKDCVLVGYDCRVLEQIDFRGKMIVGYIISRYSENVCHILNLCIDVSQQKKGLGKFLLKTVLGSLKRKDIDNIILEVRPTNLAAIALYEGFGFQHDEIKRNYYKDENGTEDALLLRKIL
ncbi:ribosomal protein S18-alanine N-acetyltransferase [Legionella sp. CNM-4043-24]|uniref:ribosomal protein S18-alanine N-acetyltransferase n=1 Tax=Legionella sp. CNM-4043-24 TaxID=3421646 RepID=UPI00403B0583